MCGGPEQAPFRRYRKHSVAALLLHGTKDVLVVARPLASTMDAIGVLGAGALGAISISQWVHAREANDRIDAASGLAWGLQGMALTARSLAKTSLQSALGVLPAVLGVTGAGLEMVLGARQFAEGIRKHQSTSQVLGGINVAAGACWALSAVSVAPPITTGAFILLTLAGSAYEHQMALKWLARRVGRKLHLVPPLSRPTAAGESAPAPLRNSG
ncbi:MAG: hypothetical protein HY319_10290 [Armatimonadetes bacterium]|nr:hypothetical protein [Armatimonadota bacterium]